MKFNARVNVKWLAKFVNAKIVGDQNLEFDGINEVHKITPGDISFVNVEKYYDKMFRT